MPRERSIGETRIGAKEEEEGKEKAEETSYHRGRNFIKTLQSTLDFHGRSREEERFGT